MSTEQDPLFTSTETAAAIAAGITLAEPSPIGDDGRFVVVTTPAGATHQVLDLDELRQKTADHPRRKTGKVELTTVDAFIEYVKRHETYATEVYADLERRRMIAVIDSDGSADEATGAQPGHKQHRAELVLKTTPAWDAWTGIDRDLLGQVAFAEHVEDRLLDITKPSGADLLAIALTFVAKKDLEFESGTRLDNGETQLVYKETVGASAGRKGELTIPARIELTIPVWLGGDNTVITARVRYRITAQGLGIGIVLDRPEDVLRLAFDDVIRQVDVDIAAPIFAGRPNA